MKLLLLLNITFPLFWALQCYDSLFPIAEKVECPRSNMRCYSEYYAVNRSGTIRTFHDQFCVDEKLCINRGINGSRTLKELPSKVQKAFVKFHVKAEEKQIISARFCCCTEDLCNFSPQWFLFSLFAVAIW